MVRKTACQSLIQFKSSNLHFILQVSILIFVVVVEPIEFYAGQFCLPHRAVFLQRRSRELLDNEELQNLWYLLDKHHTPPLVGEDQMINYEDFLKVAAASGTKCK